MAWCSTSPSMVCTPRTLEPSHQGQGSQGQGSWPRHYPDQTTKHVLNEF